MSDPLRRIASVQHGFFRTGQALDAGWSETRLHWTKRKGVIVSVARGLYRFADSPIDLRDELHRIAVLVPVGTFSHETALELWGLTDLISGTIHLSIPPESGHKSRPGLVIHHTRIEPRDRGLHAGLPVTSPARTLSDCARAGVDPGRLGHALRQAAARGLLTANEVAALRSRRGSRTDDVARNDAADLPEWEQLLRAAARLQQILPDATLVGGTAAALVAGHRRSLDADHVLAGMIGRFDDVLSDLEAAAGWHTARRQRPVVIKGSLDGIMTTVRNLQRVAPLETTGLQTPYGPLRLPTPSEILRIKAWLIVERNATRDYLDVTAISALLGMAASVRALASLDRLYPQDGDRGAVRQQLIRQLAGPAPFDLEEVEPTLPAYKELVPRWHTWSAVVDQCRALSVAMGNAAAARRAGWTDLR